MKTRLGFVELSAPNIMGDANIENNCNPIFLRIEDIVQIEPYFGFIPMYHVVTDPVQGKIIKLSNEKILVEDGSIVAIRAGGQPRVVFESPKEVIELIEAILDES